MAESLIVHIFDIFCVRIEKIRASIDLLHNNITVCRFVISEKISEYISCASAHDLSTLATDLQPVMH